MQRQAANLFTGEHALALGRLGAADVPLAERSAGKPPLVQLREALALGSVPTELPCRDSEKAHVSCCLAGPGWAGPGLAVPVALAQRCVWMFVQRCLACGTQSGHLPLRCTLRPEPCHVPFSLPCIPPHHTIHLTSQTS